MDKKDHGPGWIKDDSHVPKSWPSTEPFSPNDLKALELFSKGKPRPDTQQAIAKEQQVPDEPNHEQLEALRQLPSMSQTALARLQNWIAKRGSR